MPSRDALVEARQMLYDLLLAPYHESSHYQITSACVYLEHPLRPSGKRCICGMVSTGMTRVIPKEEA